MYIGRIKQMYKMSNSSAKSTMLKKIQPFHSTKIAPTEEI